MLARCEFTLRFGRGGFLALVAVIGASVRLLTDEPIK
jgi:hypothetical protein